MTPQTTRHPGEIVEPFNGFPGLLRSFTIDCDALSQQAVNVPLEHRGRSLMASR
jgi:hypothetical protein